MKPFSIIYFMQKISFPNTFCLTTGPASRRGLASPVIKLAPPPINKQTLDIVHDLINYSKVWPPIALARALSHDETHIEYFGQHILHHTLTQKPILTTKKWVTMFKNPVWVVPKIITHTWQKLLPHFLLTRKFCVLKNDFVLITYHRKTDSLQFPWSQMAGFTIYRFSMKLQV